MACDLVALPELAITGYPPEDLLLRPAFVAEAQRALEKVAARTGQAVAVVGFPLAERDLSNAAAVCAGGAVRGVYRKWLLPNYGVFDEARYFTANDDPGSLFVVNGVRVAVSICEDIWSPTGPIGAQAAGGAELAVNINASPYYEGRLAERETMVATRAADHSVPILYVNLVGAAGRARLRRRLGGLRRVRPHRGPGPPVRRRPPCRRPRRAAHLPQAPSRPPGPDQPPAAP